MGHYGNASIITYLSGKAEQIILFFDNNQSDEVGDKPESDELKFDSSNDDEICSSKWYVEEISGSKFLIFQYDGFKVYSNDKDQYIIADPK